MVRQEWSGLPEIGQDAIQSITQWGVADLAEVPTGGPQSMQDETLAELRNLLRQNPGMADLVVRGVETGLRSVDDYVREFASTEVQDFWSGTVRFLKMSMIRFAISMLQATEQARTNEERVCQCNG